MPKAAKHHTPLTYRPDIDGLRAIAVLVVVAFHAFPRVLSGGFIGVDMFFVISGYLITGILLKGLKAGDLNFKRFYERRIRRIFPALLTVLITIATLGWLTFLTGEFTLLGKQIVAGVFFASNFLFWSESGYFDPGVETKPLLHLWSLGVEEQFYLIWPLLLFLAWKSRHRMSILFLLFAVSLFLNLGRVTQDPIGTFYSPASRFWELWLGAALAYQHVWLKKEHVVRAKARGALAGMGLCCIAFAACKLNIFSVFPGFWAFLPTLGTCLLISAGPDTWLNRRILAHPVMVWFGLISYPLYLWHWPLLTIGRIIEPGVLGAQATAIIVAISIFLAWLTYQFIETPLRYGQRGRLKIIGLCLGMSIIAGIGYGIAAGKIKPRSARYGLEKVTEVSVHEWTFPGESLEPFLFENHKMYLERGGLPGRVLYFGDCTMEQYWDRIDELIKADPAAAKSAVFAVGRGCLPVLGNFKDNNAKCNAFNKSVTTFAMAPDVDTVVLAASWYLVLSRPKNCTQPIAGQPCIGPPEFYDGLDQFVAQMTKAGKKVYLVLGLPKGELLRPRKMVMRGWRNAGFVVDTSGVSKAELQSDISEIRSRLMAIALKHHATVIDPIEFMCPTERCPSITEDGEPIFMESTNLRPRYARTRATFMDETLTGK